jgi:hypothetical protein
MFLRSTNRRKDGKDHRYFSVVENRRVPGGRTVQRTGDQQRGYRRAGRFSDASEQPRVGAL